MRLRLLNSWFFSLGSAWFFWDALTGPQVLPGCLAFHLRQDPACLQHLLLSNQHSSTQCSLYKPLSSVDQLEVSPVCCFLVPLKFPPMTDGWMEKQRQTTRAFGQGRRKQLELPVIYRKRGDQNGETEGKKGTSTFKTRSFGPRRRFPNAVINEVKNKLNFSLCFKMTNHQKKSLKMQIFIKDNKTVLNYRS